MRRESLHTTLVILFASALTLQSASGQSAPTPTAAPIETSAPLPAFSPESPPAIPSASPLPSVSAIPTAPPTQPPIIVEPPSAGVTPGGTQTLRVMSVFGSIAITVADPAIADATVDQATRNVTITGKVIGNTVLTIRDDRGLTRTVPIRVAYPAGSIVSNTTLRITGNPASRSFVAEQALAAASHAATLRPGAVLTVATDALVGPEISPNDVATVKVPLIISGNDYFTVQGTTSVRIENIAQPYIHPSKLLVSDFPETLKVNGELFASELTTQHANRFLYYHYNPGGQPVRRIVLHAENPGAEPAIVQLISGIAGPGMNEMEVGHLSTERFLSRSAVNEGNLIVIPAHTTVALVDQALPPKNIVSGILQLRELEGAPIALTLRAQGAGDSVGGPVAATTLLEGDVPHARGVYPIPEFYFDYRYETSGADLIMPIGQIPLPNLRVGQTLKGDYGVLQSITVRIVNNDPRNAAEIALYANPRGGRATGTFIIDRVLVRAHALPTYGQYKLRQYTVPPGGFIRTEIVTMPEGGSSYPLNLIIAPDDGSSAPGAPGSLVY